MPKRRPQEYSPEEFDAVVALIRADEGLQQDIEKITGQSLADKTPRELFDLFRTLQSAVDVQATVVRYGRARTAVRRTRIEMDLDPANLPPATAQYVEDLQAKVDDERRQRLKAEAALKAMQSRNVLSLPAGTRKAAI
ncbi:hypothetical protein [Streptosporangium jomthongense]|uniref:Uncharacterized protein n=1 Tax=Streptosporangium jomthongense TaxID=1193683 RepID=A0ABV8FDE6_9ACTN